MIFTETELPGAFIIDLEPRPDARGFFARTFCRREFAAHGLSPEVAQANVAFTDKKGTLRGMHFQYPPNPEPKLVRVVRGAVLDVIVDVRPESSTFLRHVAVELTAENHRALYVPGRFAHGYQTLADHTLASYLMGEFYDPQAQGGLSPFDPRLALSWPLPVSSISEKDERWPLLADFEPELRRRMEPA